MDGHNSRRREEKREGGRSSPVHAPLPMQRETPPWGDSDFKPLPCFIFPWLLQPDQSSQLPSVTQPSSVQPGPKSPLSIQGVVLGGMEAGGRQICKCTTVILILEAGFKRTISVFLHVLAHYYNPHVLYITVSCFSKHTVLIPECVFVLYNPSQ